MNLRAALHLPGLFDDLADWLVDRGSWRAPDLVIGGDDNPYMLRWYVVPRNRWLNVYLHEILRSDDDRALHDHPWVNISILLRGAYDEVKPAWPEMWPHCRKTITVRRKTGSVVLRRPRAVHRLVLVDPPSQGGGGTAEGGASTWSLFITGPRMREWGFWCEWGWRHWRAFTAGPRGETVGPGCDGADAAQETAPPTTRTGGVPYEASLALTEVRARPPRTTGLAPIEEAQGTAAEAPQLTAIDRYLVQRCAEADGWDALVTSELHKQLEVLRARGLLVCERTPGELLGTWTPTPAGYALLGVMS